LLDFRLLSWHLLGKAEFDRYLLLWALNLLCSVKWKWDCGGIGEGVNRGGCGFLGAFAKLRKLLLAYHVYIRLSVRLSAWNNLASTGRIF
jgi:hypothetical protein